MTFYIGKHEVSELTPPLFLPEIGTFFNQDMSLANEMIEMLSNCGVTTIKGEVLHTAEICLNASDQTAYWGHKSGKAITENYRSLIERKVVSLDSYQKLFGRCFDLGLDVVVSVYDFKGVDFARDIGVSALKIASSNIVHSPLIEYVARSGIPVIMDTGHSTIEEIGRAVIWARDAGAEQLLIEHSPLAPPQPVNLHNLRFMTTLGVVFGVPFGLSDHHSGDEMLYAATALGASLLEKGVCPDAQDDEQDAAHALPISKVPDVLEKINSIHAALGSGRRELPRQRNKQMSRMGLVAGADLDVGEKISLEKISFAFPAKGIDVEYWKVVDGWKATRNIKAGEVICWQDLDAVSS